VAADTPTSNTAMEDRMTPETPTTRRRVLVTAACSACVVVASACTASPRQGSSSQVTSAQGLVKLADVPVGGAVDVKTPTGQSVLVAQPRAGAVVAFSAICTHQGCEVRPAKGSLRCPCHGSVFDTATGDVLHGPALRPLDKIPVHIDGGSVVVG
jgi:cytochrome b6-f complex iron-sulfur subunit